MAVIPRERVNCRLSSISMNLGLKRINQDECHDIFALPNYPNLSLVLATNRVKFLDFIFNAQVEGKGEIIAAFTVFLTVEILKRFSTNLAAFGSGIGKYLTLDLAGFKDLQTTAMVVKNLKPLPVKFIVYSYLINWAWKSYQETGEVCGNKLPKGLRNGDKLAEPIFTPKSKSPSGWVIMRRASDIISQHGEWTKNLSLRIYSTFAKHLESHGFILPYIVLEFDNADIISVDGIFAIFPSLWKEDEWKEAMDRGGPPLPYNEQLIRKWGMGLSFSGRLKMDQLDPENSEHIAWVHQLGVPYEVLYQTNTLNRQIFKEVSGYDLEYFHEFKMKIGGKWGI
jgi:phosphoribosylaminoimidazole-succinocarboxamide synthase